MDAHETGALREALKLPYFRQVPLEAIAAGAAGLEYGAGKYANRNWEKGLPWQQMIDSLRRHIDDFERRCENDEETNMHQVCFIMANSMMLSASVIRGVGLDNRIGAPPPEALSGKECAKWIEEQLKKVPPKPKPEENLVKAEPDVIPEPIFGHYVSSEELIQDDTGMEVIETYSTSGLTFENLMSEVTEILGDPKKTQKEQI